MNITKISILVLTLLVSTVSLAQKGSVSKAESYMNKSDFANAKAEIDVAVTIEKVAAKSRTWYVRGQIYEGIATSEDMSISSIDPEALTKAMEAYNKVQTMEKETASYYTMTTLKVDALWGNFLNIGGIAYGEEDFELALNSFEKALTVKEGDSTTLLYAGAAAQQKGDDDKTLAYYQQMIEKKQAGSSVYSTAIYLYRKKEDNEKALELVGIAKEVYPEDSKFGQEEISLLLTMKKMDEAQQRLITAIEEDPTNVNYRLNLGVLYDNLANAQSEEEGKYEESEANYEKALEGYLKAVELDPENYVGNFNSGVIYVNRAKTFYDEVRDMDLASYDKYGPAKLEKANNLLTTGLPYMEKAMQIKTDDIAGLEALQQMYVQLKMMDKAEEVMNRVDELEAAAGAAATE